VAAVAQFSPFVIGQTGGLPIQLASFSGVPVGNSVRLTQVRQLQNIFDHFATEVAQCIAQRTAHDQKSM
jgi:hypothetical protein